jgi:hypothetical protein
VRRSSKQRVAARRATCRQSKKLTQAGDDRLSGAKDGMA